MPRGYDRPLYILPFDHRGSFQTKMFGWQSPLSDAQTAEIAGAKRVIYDGFLYALAGGVPREKAGILVDEQFGASILHDAPRLMVEAIEELQHGGVDPDLWKVEGLVWREDCERVVAAARAGGRHHVGCIVLGRGEDDRKVREWLGIAAAVPGFVGFAIGRTVFWDPLVAWRSKRATRAQTVAEIGRRYRQFVDLFERKDASVSSVASSSARPEHRTSMEG
jgi:5-dehydro-2-deoxygluconokinase